MHNLSGIHSALITPFDDAGAVDTSALSDLVRFELGQGIDGFYVGGSTGEAFLQNAVERAAFLAAVAHEVAAVDPSATLIAHVGAIATSEALELGRAAVGAGYHAISAIPPFYYEFSREQHLAHYFELADRIALPLLVYNFPKRVGTALGTAQLLQLLEHPNIVGIKHTSQDLYQLEQIKRARPDAILFNGFDEMFLAGLAMGADGAIGSTYNFMGALFVAMRERFVAGHAADALALQRTANQVIDMLVEVGVFEGTKRILAVLGHDCGPCRKPFLPLAPAALARVDACVREVLLPALALHP
ncbi:MAG: N-acetylneuraminate lyase [Betaproteobacteria bacterium]